MKLLKLVPDDTNVKFLKWRKLAFGLSIFFMIASVGLVATKGLNFGVDFIGGQMIRATFTQSAEAPVTELREPSRSIPVRPSPSNKRNPTLSKSPRG